MNIRLGSFAVVLACSLAGTTLPAQVPQIINYQGRVVVGSSNFNGTGQFKFALINNANGQNVWSNDNTTGAGTEPTDAVSLSVSNGLYSVLLGDTSIPNMAAIPGTVFSNPDVRLRVWFNDGTHGFQAFSPDQRIASVGYAIIAGTVPDLAITTSKLANNSVTSAKIDNTTVQQRVTGSAVNGRFIRAINADGTVVTGADDDSGGTVTSVTAAAPLSATNSTTTPAISLTGTVPVANGGTGTTTYPPNSLPVTNGTAAFGTTGPLTDGQLVIGRTGLTPTVGTLNGTANEITVTPGSGTITLSLAHNPGTDISANLEEEGQINSTNISGNASTGGQFLLGNGANSATWVALSGDVLVTSGGAASIQPNAVALGQDTTGTYVASISTNNGLTGGFAIEAAAPTLGLDYSATLTSNSLSSNQTQFASTGVIFEGSTVNANQGLLTTANPTADRTWTLPDATGTVITTGNLSSITSVGTLTQLVVNDGPTALGNGGSSSVVINSSTWDVSPSGDITTPGSVTTTGSSAITAGGRVTIGTFANLTKSGPLAPNGTNDLVATTSYLQLSAPAGGTLDTLNGGTVGQIAILAGPITNSINVLDLTNGGASSGNINLSGTTTYTMDANDTLTLLFDGTNWLELARSVN